METLENRYNKLKEQFDKLNSEKTKMEGEKEVYKKIIKKNYLAKNILYPPRSRHLVRWSL